MKEKKRVDGVAILVYMAMVLLIAIIVAPPLLRTFLPPEVKEVTPVEKVEALICNKQMELNNANVSVRATTTYKGDNLFRLILLYSSEQDDSTSPETEQPPQDVNTNPFTDIPEIQTLQNIDGVMVDSSLNQVKVDITQDVFLNESDNPDLSVYNQGIQDQQMMFEDQGYSCQITTSE